MGSEKVKFITLIFFLLFFIPSAHAQHSLSERDSVLLKNGISILRKYFVEKGYWNTYRR
jgi:hypothetical protein